MTIPRDLSLRKTAEGLRLFQQPVPELKKLRDRSVKIEPAEIKGEVPLSQIDFPASQMELLLEFDPANSPVKEFGVKISNGKDEYYLVGIDLEKQVLFSDRTHSGKTDFSPLFASRRHTAPLPPGEGKIKMHLYLDRASCELFLNDGERVMTEIFFPNEDYSTVSLFAEGGSVSLLSGEAHRLNSIW
jgi:sucrose-6-phosphate hydrolase SacC (GH32 family)